MGTFQSICMLIGLFALIIFSVVGALVVLAFMGVAAGIYL